MKSKIVLIFTLIINFVAFPQKTELKPFTDFLQENEFLSAKDYILNKFQSKDIVIISERDHRDFSQYEVIFDVLRD